jgi:hypothetical protein
MSIDLQGWYIKTSDSVRFRTAAHKLEVMGANHDWGYKAVGHTDENGKFVADVVYHDGSGPQWYSADRTHTFMEQVQCVIDRCREWAEVRDLEEFWRRAADLQYKALELDKPIRSEWW